MSRLLRVTLSSVVVILARLATATEPPPEIHACPDAAGGVVYQDGECEAAAPAATAVAPAKAAPRGRTTTPTKVASKARSTVPAVKRTPSAPTKGIKPVINPATFTSDPRWGSPERTLRTFVSAMKAADRGLVRACLTADALATFGVQVEGLPPESLRATVDAYTGFVLEGDLGPVWAIRAIRGKDRPKWIFFERVEDGTWKISAI